MLKAIRVSTLIMLLACPAQAGYMQTGGSPQPPPPSSQPATDVEEPMTDDLGETSTNGYIQNEEPGALTQVALDLLAVLPSLL